jgi:hypothetical protein
MKRIISMAIKPITFINRKAIKQFIDNCKNERHVLVVTNALSTFETSPHIPPDLGGNLSFSYHLMVEGMKVLPEKEVVTIMSLTACCTDDD